MKASLKLLVGLLIAAAAYFMAWPLRYILHMPPETDRFWGNLPWFLQPFIVDLFGAVISAVIGMAGVGLWHLGGIVVDYVHARFRSAAVDLPFSFTAIPPIEFYPQPPPRVPPIRQEPMELIPLTDLLTGLQTGNYDRVKYWLAKESKLKTAEVPPLTNELYDRYRAAMASNNQMQQAIRYGNFVSSTPLYQTAGPAQMWISQGGGNSST